MSRSAASGPNAALAALASFDRRVEALCGVGLATVQERIRQAMSGRGEGRDGLPLYRFLGYHLGLSGLDGQPMAGAAAGKGIRPMVCLCAAAAVGDRAAGLANLAAAIQLTHEFSLIHDDIEDRDHLRRGRPALWTEVGDAQAINAGDALFAIARGLLSHPDRGYGADEHLAICAVYDEACLRLAEGQQQDILFEARAEVGRDAYLRMIRDKTGALLGAAAAMGILAGGGDAATADAMGRFGEALGEAFQIRDDHLGLWGDPAATGKPAGNDLRRGKRSLPMILALGHPRLGPRLGEAMAGLRSGAEMEGPVVDEILASMAAAGIADAVSAQAQEAAAAALGMLEALPLRREPAAILAGLVRASVDRDR